MPAVIDTGLNVVDARDTAGGHPVGVRARQAGGAVYSGQREPHAAGNYAKAGGNYGFGGAALAYPARRGLCRGGRDDGLGEGDRPAAARAARCRPDGAQKRCGYRTIRPPASWGSLPPRPKRRCGARWSGFAPTGIAGRDRAAGGRGAARVCRPAPPPGTAGKTAMAGRLGAAGRGPRGKVRAGSQRRPSGKGGGGHGRGPGARTRRRSGQFRLLRGAGTHARGGGHFRRDRCGSRQDGGSRPPCREPAGRCPRHPGFHCAGGANPGGHSNSARGGRPMQSRWRPPGWRSGYFRPAYPSIVYRSITDLSDESFALDLNAALRTDGHFDTMFCLRHLLTRPAAVAPEMLRLWKRSRIAALKLGEFIADCRF